MMNKVVYKTLCIEFSKTLWAWYCLLRDRIVITVFIRENLVAFFIHVHRVSKKFAELPKVIKPKVHFWASSVIAIGLFHFLKTTLQKT